MADYNDFSEFYEITKTLEIVAKTDFDGGGGPSTLRLEIIQCLHTGNYSVRWSQHTNFHLQPSYPVTHGEFATAAGDFSVWVPFEDMPYVHEKTEKQAVQRALGWLKDRGG
ncbi:hypothetical protein So717_17310 [Roseobacter cerasinus]|uniref:Uncharacterized protein n=1 Tax=Roseobacter cerasinus TaxID=2602289 RepID=A0A640VNE4_9RHOB|nr:hypothetical protein [Roseobacter cerasinus]GFE49978.1 hypothetical protein So717_17310 [Roseobacter cerasinus]